MSDSPACLFVYGTLRKALGHPMFRLIEQYGKFVAAARMAGRLYDLGRYPGMLPPRTADDWVYGELYELAGSTVWTLLDNYEGCGAKDTPPYEFARFSHQVWLTAGHAEVAEAWVYLYTGTVSEECRIPSGDYLEFLGNRRPMRQPQELGGEVRR